MSIGNTISMIIILKTNLNKRNFNHKTTFQFPQKYEFLIWVSDVKNTNVNEFFTIPIYSPHYII